MKVLVFDSGKGGEYVTKVARERFPHINFDFISDSNGMPYSNKSPAEIIESATRVLDKVIDEYQIILIACHTLTQVGIQELRGRYPSDKQFVGFDPGIKKAYDLGFREICVFATPPTLDSNRYKEIKSQFDFDLVVEPDCSIWAESIENETFDPKIMISTLIKNPVQCVVLACTHYFLFEHNLTNYFSDITIINPTQSVLDQLGRLLTDS